MPVKPNYASKYGLVYHATNGHPIPNAWEKDLKGLTTEWQPVAMTMQVAEAKKMLGSVRKICEAGNNVVFDDDGIQIVNKRTGWETPIAMMGGACVFELWINTPDRHEVAGSKTDFARPS